MSTVSSSYNMTDTSSMSSTCYVIMFIHSLCFICTMSSGHASKFNFTFGPEMSYKSPVKWLILLIKIMSVYWKNHMAHKGTA